MSSHAARIARRPRRARVRRRRLGALALVGVLALGLVAVITVGRSGTPFVRSRFPSGTTT